ncbi:MAG: efflux RND transporter periplasmic adaptor subunit [Firmicutes bacterium]|nr:efflux RND transporter periplasmic adaptor subunit [Bacillota bacterium]
MSRSKKLLALLIIVVIVGVGVVVSLLSGKAEPKGATVETATVALDDFTITVTGSGLVEGIESKEVRASVGGRVEQVLVDEGEFVTIGQIIAVLDKRDLQSQLQTAKASLASIQAEVNQLESEIDWDSIEESLPVKQAKSQLTAAQARLNEVLQGATPAQLAQAENAVVEASLALEQAEANLAKMERLYFQQAISRQQLLDAEHSYTLAKQRYENAVNQLEILKSGPTKEQVAVAEAQLNDAKLAVISAERQAQWKQDSLVVAKERLLQAENNVALIEEQLTETDVTTPYQGMVTKKLVSPGVYLTAGTPVIEVADLSRLVVVARIDEVDVTSVVVGQEVKITSDAFVGDEFYGVVKRIAPQPIYEGKVAKYNVTIELENPPEGLRPGMNADVEIITLKRQSLVVPIHAVVTTTTSDAVPASTGEATKAVFVVRDGKAVKVPVKTGETSLTVVEVLEGLNPGDRIVTGSYYTLQRLKDGDPVNYSDSVGDGQ